MEEIVQDYYLSHHGILGQKWGKRNGPPYPLGVSDHSASERKAGWENSLDKSGGISESDIIVGAYITAIAMVPISRIIRNQMAISKGKKLVKQYEKENALDNKTPKSINSKDINPLKGTMNCGACCMSEEMRIRGTSCSAKLINGMLIEDVAKCFKGATEKSWDSLSKDCVKPGNGKETRDNLGKEIASKYPEGSRGCMYMPMWFGNHYITWEVKDGETNFKNPQDSKLDLTNNCFSAMIQSGTVGADEVGIRTMRWDNLEFRKDKSDEVLYTDKGSIKKKFRGG